MQNSSLNGHLTAIFTIFLWGMTFISTKILLQVWPPVIILFLRFVIGFIALWLIKPQMLHNTTWRQELTFMTAGICGITLYYLLENVALTYTQAANVSVIISAAPFFTLLVSHWLRQDDGHIRFNFLLGFVVAMLGIALLSASGSTLHLNPLGDFLALAAAFVWALYSQLVKKIDSFGFNLILTTRRIFFYGLLFILPIIMLTDKQISLLPLRDFTYLLNLLFLGLGASALCFVTWNLAVKLLGAVKTSIYIYLNPVITLCGSIIILHEQLTALMTCGVILALAGLLISELPDWGLKDKIPFINKRHS